MKELILKDTNTMKVGDKISDTNGYMYACTNIYSDNDGYTHYVLEKVLN